MENEIRVHNPGYQVSDYKSKIGKIVRQVTLSRMHQYTDNESFKLVEFDEETPQGYVFANSMSVIVIAGKSLRIILKAHFNHKDSKPIARQLFGTEDIDDMKSFDVMKEYCNLAAGFIKKICIEQDIPVGISLPIVTLGFNEVFSSPSDLEQKTVFEDAWCLKNEQSNIVCSCLVDVFESETVDNLMEYELTEAEEDNDSDYEFL
ncbi:MAG: hypothetical protein MJE63_18180 [Proteobacteria bacterium]|nr:hypothetical protein [Pseudomonadota bacterium]